MFHVTLAVPGRFHVFREEAERRLAVRAMARVGGEGLLAWGLAGDHMHTLLDGSDVEIGPLVRALRLSLRALGAWFDERDRRAITSRWDLENVVGYVLRQARKHDCCDRPALFDGSCFPDLVGARLLDGWSPAPLHAHLPRLDLARYAEDVAVRRLPEPASDDLIRVLGAVRLVAAAAAAHGVPFPLAGNELPVVRARRSAAALGEAAGIPRSEMAFALGVTPQATGRLVRSPRDPRAEAAVRLRLGLEEVAMRIERPAPSGRALQAS